MLMTEKVETALTDRIISGTYAAGCKLPSIRRLSEEMSASYVTVSRAVDMLKRKGLVVTQAGRGTFVADRSPEPGRTGVREICYVFADPDDNPQGEYQLELYSEIQQLVRRAGFMDRALLPDEAYLRCNDTIAGVIVANRPPFIRTLQEQGIPVVHCSSIPAESSLSSVCPDFYHGSYEVTRHLLGQGHRQVRFVSAADDANRNSFIARGQGYHDAMLDGGLTPSEPVYWHHRTAPDALRRLLLSRTERPTALFVANDMMAVEILQLAAELKIAVPEELSVAGLENMRCSRLAAPPLTTAGYDKKILAAETVRLLLEMIGGRETNSVRKQIPMQLITRDSVKRI